MNSFTSITACIRRFYRGSSDPTRDWLAMLTVSLFILIGIIVWNMWAFDTAASGGVIGASATTTPSAFTQSSLNTIRSVFSNRAEEEAKYETGTYHFADPSQ
jgi:hypothetical protein